VVQLDDGRIIRDEQAGRYETEQIPAIGFGPRAEAGS